MALEYTGRMMQSLEVMFLLLLVGAPWSWMTFAESVIILAFTSLFANLLGFIPMQLGGREGGFAMSTAQLGLTGGTGLFISLVCRARELAWMIVGLLLMRVGNGRRHATAVKNPDKRDNKDGVTARDI